MPNIPLNVHLKARWDRLVKRNCECTKDQDGKVKFCTWHLLDKDPKAIHGLEYGRVNMQKFIDEEFKTEEESKR